MKSLWMDRLARFSRRVSAGVVCALVFGVVGQPAAEAAPKRDGASKAAKTSSKISSKTSASRQKKAAPKTLASCSWNRPGANPYMGELPAALDRYTDMPAGVRARLKDRIAAQQYDDMVEIRRDAIVGQGIYAADIRDMHFGSTGTVCKTVSRKKWKASTTERGLVYCEGSQCVLVPTVCRNVSRVTRRDAPPSAKAPTAVSPATASAPSASSSTAAAKPDGAAASAAPVAAAPAAAPTAAVSSAPVTALEPSFGEVAQGPIFGFPIGPGGGGSTLVVVPPSGGGGTPSGGSSGGTTGGGTGGGTTPGGGTTGGGTTGGTPGGAPGTVPDPGGPTPGGGVVGGVVVTPVPEPSTWGLMVIGLVALGAWSRRRRST